MPLSFKAVFDVMNINYNTEPEYQAEEILNEFAAQRDHYRASTPEKCVLLEGDAVVEPEVLETTLNQELDSSFDCMLDSAPDPNKTYSVSTLSGVGRFNESDEREPTTVAEKISDVVPPGSNESDGREYSTVAENVPDVVPSGPPLPNLDKGEKSSKKRKKDQRFKHPMLNLCPNTGKLRTAVELPSSSGCASTCKKLCGTNFTSSVRENIH